MPNVHTPRVLLIVPQRLLREGLQSLLEQSGDARVVGACGSLADARERLPATTAVDAVLLDVSRLEVPLRTAALQRLRREFPRARVVLLADEPEITSEATLLATGADAVVLPHAGREALVESLRRSTPVGLAGSTFPPTRSARHRLTTHELDVLLRVAEGHRTTEIAASLHRSPKTIEKHRASVLRKLGLRNATEVAAYAIFAGLVSRERVFPDAQPATSVPAG